MTTRVPARVLVIEDNAANLDLMTYLLRAFGCAPLTAMDGEAGLSVAKRERPDLIVCDIQIPLLDGLQSCDQRTPVTEFSVTDSGVDIRAEDQTQVFRAFT